MALKPALALEVAVMVALIAQQMALIVARTPVPTVTLARRDAVLETAPSKGAVDGSSSCCGKATASAGPTLPNEEKPFYRTLRT